MQAASVIIPSTVHSHVPVSQADWRPGKSVLLEMIINLFRSDYLCRSCSFSHKLFQSRSFLPEYWSQPQQPQQHVAIRSSLKSKSLVYLRREMGPKITPRLSYFGVRSSMQSFRSFYLRIDLKRIKRLTEIQLHFPNPI